jgi:hypothetical protein
LKIGALFTTESPDRIVFFIVSYAADYQYATSSYLSILVDGENLLDKNYQASRVTSVENGLAVEFLRVPLGFSDFERIINASRIDISPNFRTFTVSYENKNILSNFYQKLIPIAETATLKKQDLQFERAARQKALDEEQRKRQEKEEAIQKAANEEKRKAQAQEYEMKRCKLTLDQSPEIRGLRLGMSKRYVMPRFRNNYNTETDRGLEHCNSVDGLFWSPYNVTQSFDGIRSYKLGFIGDRLYSIEILYSEVGYNKKDFLSDLSKHLTLPQYWSETGSYYDDYYSASCDGWNIKVGIQGSRGSLLIYEDSDAVTKNCQKQKDANSLPVYEQKRKVFKP